MKNLVRFFCLFVLAFLLCSFVPLNAANTGSIQTMATQDSPNGGGCPPMQNCVPLVDSQPIPSTLQDGPNGGGCPPMQNCIPVASSSTSTKL